MVWRVFLYSLPIWVLYFSNLFWDSRDSRFERQDCVHFSYCDRCIGEDTLSDSKHLVLEEKWAKPLPSNKPLPRFKLKIVPKLLHNMRVHSVGNICNTKPAWLKWGSFPLPSFLFLRGHKDWPVLAYLLAVWINTHTHTHTLTASHPTCLAHWFTSWAVFSHGHQKPTFCNYLLLSSEMIPFTSASQWVG